jgi:hypothetical protein
MVVPSYMVVVGDDWGAAGLDCVLEADGRLRVRVGAILRPATQAAQVGPEAQFRLPWDVAAVRVGNRPVEQAGLKAVVTASGCNLLRTP